MSENSEDAQFHERLQTLLLYHTSMLSDTARNVPFRDALESVVNADTQVLDIGAGSGIWSVWAAKLGAKSVTAVESEDIMIPIIQAHARENDVAGQIEVIHGDSRHIELPGKYDVIVSETIGNQAFDEGIIATLTDARERFLADGGLIIPKRVTLVTAPIHLPIERLPSEVPITVSYLEKLSLNISFEAPDRDLIEVLSQPLELFSVDFSGPNEASELGNIEGMWDITDLSRANAFVLWARSELIDGINVDTWDTKSWSPVICRFDPFSGGGRLKLLLNATSDQYHWTVSSPDTHAAPRSYSSVFAFASLRFNLRSRSSMNDQ